MRDIEQVLLSLNISAEDISKAKTYQEKYGGALERLLVNMGSLSEDLLGDFYTQLLDVKRFSPNEASEWTLPKEALSTFNIEFLSEKNWLPFEFHDGKWVFVTANPLDWEVIQYLEMKLAHYQIEVANDEDLSQLISKIQSEEQEIHTEADLLSDVEEEKLRELATEAPTVNLLNLLISRALKQGASDMHIEPQGGRCKVRFRIDGVLREVDVIPQRLQLALISRLKILANMDIAEKRRPQDGKIEMKISSVDLDIRVSALPLNEGESMVLRFLRKDSITYDMSVLGLSEDIADSIQQDLTNTAGVILLTGPTGSGKTTTLYTCLNELNNEDVKIITLEDPVEYQLEGVNQVQVNSEIGFDFSAGLRSIVRQDPDIIMVGEIRDAETARIAMQSALTGHLVFSTVHTNDAPSAYTRLLDLGVEEFLLNAALISVIAQRLVRKICPHCAEQIENAESLIEKYRLNDLAARHQVEKINLVKGAGCDKCAHSGYKGRLAVIEYLSSDEKVRALPKDEQFIPKAKKHNSELGRRTLLEDGLLKAIQGQTTIDEVIRVCG